MRVNLDLYPRFWDEDMLIFNEAIASGVEDWYSRYGEFSYRFTTEKNPFEGIPVWDSKNDVPAVIPDPEHSDIDNLIKSVGQMSIAKILTADKHRPPIKRIKGYKNEKRNPVRATIFNIDAMLKEASVFDLIGIEIQDITLMKRAVEYEQDLVVALESLKSKMC